MACSSSLPPRSPRSPSSPLGKRKAASNRLAFFERQEKDRLDGLCKKHDGRMEDLYKRRDDLTRRLDEYHGNLQERTKQVEQFEERLAMLKVGLRNGEPLEAEIAETERRIAQTRTDISQTRTDISQMDTRISQIDTHISQTRTDISRILTELKELKVGAEISVESDSAVQAEDYFDLVRRAGSPSSLCKSKNWRKAQEVPLYLCHIPPPETEPPFPLTLAHPAFANFDQSFNSSTIEFGSRECELVNELCSLAAHEFKDEKEKMHEFNTLLSTYVGQAIVPVGVKNYTTDGSCVLERHMVCTVEGKKDEGMSLFQAMHYYGLFLDGMEKLERESTFCPCFLVEFVGVQIRISGLAFFSKVACQPFTPFMHCYFNSYDKRDMDSLCRAMLALKQGISELRQYYNAQPPVVDKSIPYPLQEKQVKFEARIDKKLLFVVKMPQAEELRLFKFCKRYGGSVHQRWAEGGLAPKLFNCEELRGGWFRVEMEYLSDNWESVYQWRNSHQKIDESRLQLAVQGALDKALNLDKEMAHGDVRAPNIMAKSVEGTFEIKFVDFDWAGTVSSTCYPSFINPDENWHEGVGPGKPLCQNHDKWWVDKWIF